jgi:glycine cleavage system aminomethyltransferase T
MGTRFEFACFKLPQSVLTLAIMWLWPAPHDGQPSENCHQTVMREEYVKIGDSGPKSRALLCSVFRRSTPQYLYFIGLMHGVDGQG